VNGAPSSGHFENAEKQTLASSHTSLPRNSLLLLNVSSHIYSQRIMKTTSRGSEDEKRVGDGMVDIANLVGPPTTGSLSVGGTPSDPTDAIEGHKEEKALAGPTSEEDGISPDDAPEVVLGDTDEDVRAITR